jgi:hypothetical protein
MTLISKEDWTTYFKFLDNLRKSGETNMYAASSYLVDAYDIPEGDAKKILAAWMRTFKDGSASAEARAEQVI